jgi:hypothetical protein
MAYNISVAVGDKLTIRSETSGTVDLGIVESGDVTAGTVVSGVEVSLPQAARTRVAASAAVSARMRDILIIDIVLPPGIGERRVGPSENS